MGTCDASNITYLRHVLNAVIKLPPRLTDCQTVLDNRELRNLAYS